MTSTTTPAIKPRNYGKRGRALLNLLHDIRDCAKELDRLAAEARAVDEEVFFAITKNEHEPAGSESAAADYLMCLSGIPLVADGIYGLIDSHLPHPIHYRPDAADAD